MNAEENQIKSNYIRYHLLRLYKISLDIGCDIRCVYFQI